MNFLLLSIPKIYLQFPIAMNFFYFLFEKGFVRCVKPFVFSQICVRQLYNWNFTDRLYVTQKYSIFDLIQVIIDNLFRDL